jgi:hypothetical protein
MRRNLAARSGFRVLVGGMMSELRLIYHVLEHLEVGLHFSNVENEFLFDQLILFGNKLQSSNDVAVSKPDNQKTESILAELWKIAETKRKEQEEEMSMKRLEGKYSIIPLRK